MLEWLKNPSGAYNLTLIVAVIAWLVSGIGIFAGFHLNKLRTIEAQQKANLAESGRAEVAAKLATTTTELEKSKTQTAEVAARLAKFTSPRRLTVEQFSTLRNLLPNGPKGKVVVTFLSVENDAESYSGEIAKLLTEAGFEVTTSKKLWLQLALDGLFICVRDLPTVPAHAVHIQNCFKSAGLAVAGFESIAMFNDFGSPIPNDAIIFAVSNRK